MVQSEHLDIQTQVSEIIADLPDVQTQVEALVFWVFQNLRKEPVASISGAAEILKQKVGDCTEHTTLFTALARAARIPTKIHVGLVYVQGAFLYHAWPVVAIENQWVDVDPSLGQFPADATHIALLEGDFTDLSQLLNLLGKVRIKVLEYAY